MTRWQRVLVWCLLWLLAAAALVNTIWQLFGHIPYRIDIDVYQMGGQTWLDGRPLYSGDVKFHTPIGLDLPFTYPPLAAVAFCPFAWLHMPAASVAITALTLILLIVSTVIVLSSLDVWNTSRCYPGRPGCAGCGWRSSSWRRPRSGWSPSSRTSRSARSTSC